MDKGAARSRKRASQATKGGQPPAAQGQGQTQAGPSKSRSERRADRPDGPGPAGAVGEASASGPKSKGKGKGRDKGDLREERTMRDDKKGRNEAPPAPSKRPTTVDPNQYKPKAIRTSAALIYSQTPFALPPPEEALANVRRVDLTGSGATDVSWLAGKGVTWLSLAGCKVESGWEAVGSLKELSVLNISGCGLKSLPAALANLTNLKAIVAMNNEWTALDSDVIASWKDLNSLIISHSPNLTSIPSSLSSLLQLSKLTFSHCPRLTAASLPDLSPLPLLRDVKMNNLPLLTSLPAHITSWGKGDLSLVGKGKDDDTKMRLGDGLEVLDLGNCSLDFASISSIFGLSQSGTGTKKKSSGLSHLRSLSLHSNPLTLTHPNYVELLQGSKDLPNLQIIDAKRVVERRRKGEISEKKVKERTVGARASGANVNAVGGAKMRTWGDKGDGAEAAKVTEVDGDKSDKPVVDGQSQGGDKKDKKKKRKEVEADGVVSTKSKKRRHEDIPLEQSSKRNKRSSPVPPTKPQPQSNPSASAEKTTSSTLDALRSAPDAAPSTQRDKGKQATGTVGVIEVKGGRESELTSKQKKKIKAKLKKGSEVSGGIDLKELFGKKQTEVGQAPAPAAEGDGMDVDVDDGSGLGLGVGGW